MTIAEDLRCVMPTKFLVENKEWGWSGMVLTCSHYARGMSWLHAPSGRDDPIRNMQLSDTKRCGHGAKGASIRLAETWHSPCGTHSERE